MHVKRITKPGNLSTGKVKVMGIWDGNKPEAYKAVVNLGGFRTPDGGKLCIANEKWDFKMSPLLTVEFCTKWYELFLLRDDGPGKDLGLYSIHFGHLDTAARHLQVSAFVDHVPNPVAVRLFARQNGYEIDELAWDLISGRWQNEAVNEREEECSICDGKGKIPLGLSDWKQKCTRCKGFGAFKPGA